MLVVLSKERLQHLLYDEIGCWETVGGGPNLDAFSFNPEETDPKILKELGYYDNRESWLSGARIKDLTEYIKYLDTLPQYMGK